MTAAVSYELDLRDRPAGYRVGVDPKRGEALVSAPCPACGRNGVLRKRGHEWIVEHTYNADAARQIICKPDKLQLARPAFLDFAAWVDDWKRKNGDDLKPLTEALACELSELSALLHRSALPTKKLAAAIDQQANIAPEAWRPR